jgi:uncharacterized protein (DUF433 family)
MFTHITYDPEILNGNPHIRGPMLLVEAAANTLVKIGVKADQIRTKRFGPTGG